MPECKRILLLASNPLDSKKRFDKEYKEISQSIRLGKYRDLCELHKAFALSTRDISRKILEVRPHILHFTGQGTPKGKLVIREAKSQKLISPDAIGKLLSSFSDTIELVILNACYSDLSAEEILKHIPFVIGMQDAIQDETAIEFAIGLYDAMGDGRFNFNINELKWAVDYAKNTAHFEGAMGSDLPILRYNEKINYKDIPPIIPVERNEPGEIDQPNPRVLQSRPKFGRLYEFNCNRRDAVKQFWKVFEGFESNDQKIQIYFICSDYHQKGNSLAKRITLELKEYFEEKDTPSNIFIKEESKGDFSIIDLGSFEPNIRINQSRFVKEFEAFWGGIIQENGNWEYFTLIIEISLLSLKEGDKELRGHFQFIIDHIKKKCLGKTTYIILFSLLIRENFKQEKVITRRAKINLFNLKKKKNVINEIRKIQKDNSKFSTLIGPLKYVEREHIIDWLRNVNKELGSDKYREIDIQEYIQTLRKQITTRERILLFEEKGLINMEDVEKFQKKVLQDLISSRKSQIYQDTLSY